MKKYFPFLYKRALPVILGALSGYAYYTFIGCNGSCAIAGNPYISTLYGAAIGFFLALPSKKKSEQQ
ncbi:MAG: DUF6132 family protein [bacterium]